MPGPHQLISISRAACHSLLPRARQPLAVIPLVIVPKGSPEECNYYTVDLYSSGNSTKYLMHCYDHQSAPSFQHLPQGSLALKSLESFANSSSTLPAASIHLQNSQLFLTLLSPCKSNTKSKVTEDSCCTKSDSTQGTTGLLEAPERSLRSFLAIHFHPFPSQGVGSESLFWVSK